MIGRIFVSRIIVHILPVYPISLSLGALQLKQRAVLIFLVALFIIS